MSFGPSLTSESRNAAREVHGVQRQLLTDTGLHVSKVSLKTGRERTCTFRLVKVEVLQRQVDSVSTSISRI